MDKELLKELIDTIFSTVEKAEVGHPIALAATKALNVLIDDVVLDKIVTALEAKDITVTSA